MYPDALIFPFLMYRNTLKVQKMTKVAISDEAYERLSKLKRVDESFSDLVMRLTEKDVTKPLSSFAGCWKGDKEELDKITAELERERHEAKSRDFEI